MGWKTHYDKGIKGCDGGLGDSHHKKESFRDKRCYRKLYSAMVNKAAKSGTLNLYM